MKDIEEKINKYFIERNKKWWTNPGKGKRVIDSYIKILPKDLRDRIHAGGMNVLDIGSGPHQFLLRMREFGNEIFAVDKYPKDDPVEAIGSGGYFSINLAYKYLAEKYSIKYKGDGAFGSYGENFGFNKKFDLINIRDAYKFLEAIELKGDDDKLIDKFLVDSIRSLSGSGYLVIRTTKKRCRKILKRFVQLRFIEGDGGHTVFLKKGAYLNNIRFKDGVIKL